MTDPLFDPEAVIDAMSPMLGLDVPPETRAAVAENLRIAARFARILFETPIDDHAEPAAIFMPGPLPDRDGRA